ncbi:MAG: hypothetical protein LBO65_09600 [Spirochaetaceae bacterium]|jgi:hypothetical protein|nr:hypothetical protein [Spirochaetaceae bacterium]
MEFFRLFLKAPLYYRREDINPFARGEGGLPVPEELLFCFTLDSQEARRIDPGPEQYLGPLSAAGRRFPEGEGTPPEDVRGQPEKETPLELAAGLYYFTQIRGCELSGIAGTAQEPPGQKQFNRDDFIEAAMELQKEGLWERLKLKDRICLRRLFEDGAPVIQILRPLQDPLP